MAKIAKTHEGECILNSLLYQQTIHVCICVSAFISSLHCIDENKSSRVELHEHGVEEKMAPVRLQKTGPKCVAHFTEHHRNKKKTQTYSLQHVSTPPRPFLNFGVGFRKAVRRKTSASICASLFVS